MILKESDHTDRSKNRIKNGSQNNLNVIRKKTVSSDSESSAATSSSDEWESLSSSDDSDFAPFNPVEEIPETRF